MKKLLVLISIFSFNYVIGQTPEDIVNSFRQKKIDYVVSNSFLPFDLRSGSFEDDENIISGQILKKKLTKLFNDNYFDDLLKGKKIKDSKLKISFVRKTFDKHGELESESRISFFFKKGKDGRIKLSSIILAG